jgi:hypothetical protein
MFFFDVNETADQIIYRFRYRFLILIAFICSVAVSLLFPFLLQILTPWALIIVDLLPIIIILVFFIDFFRVMFDIQQEKKKGYHLRTSGKLISLENQWAIVLTKTK